MKERYVSINPAVFRSLYIPVAAVFFSMAALCGFFSVLIMLLPGSISALTDDLITGGITEASAVRTWRMIHIVLTVSTFIFPAILALGYILTICKQPGKGLVFLCNVFEWLLKIIKIVAKVLIAVLIFRVIRYAVLVLPMNEGMYYLYAMLVSEALMLLISGALYVMLCRFLNGLCDSAASIADTLENSRLGAKPIPGFAATGFLIFGSVGLLFGLDRLFTVVIVQEYHSSHYAVLTEQHPMLILSGISLSLSALASMLSAIFLYGFKRKSEKLYHTLRQNMMK